MFLVFEVESTNLWAADVLGDLVCGTGSVRGLGCPSSYTENFLEITVVLSWDESSHDQRGILLAVEGPKFLTHKGVDFETSGVGQTTIPQMLA